MTTDLTCLAANALWGLLLVLIEIGGKTALNGVAWNTGNRDRETEALPAWIQRTSRALGNHKENFPLFLAAVVVTHLAGRANATTATASVVYVIARATHGFVYIAGITGVRSLAFIVGLGATLVIYARLLGLC